MSTTIRLVSPKTKKILPRDTTKSLAALMSLRFAMNIDCENDFQDDIKIKDAAWLNTVGDYLDWPIDILQDFKTLSKREFVLKTNSLKSRSKKQLSISVPSIFLAVLKSSFVSSMGI